MVPEKDQRILNAGWKAIRDFNNYTPSNDDSTELLIMADRLSDAFETACRFLEKYSDDYETPKTC